MGWEDGKRLHRHLQEKTSRNAVRSKTWTPQTPPATTMILSARCPCSLGLALNIHDTHAFSNSGALRTSEKLSGRLSTVLEDILDLVDDGHDACDGGLQCRGQVLLRLCTDLLQNLSSDASGHEELKLATVILPGDLERGP